MIQKLSRGEIAEIHNALLDKVKLLFNEMEATEDYDNLDHIQWLLDIDFKICCLYINVSQETKENEVES